LSDKRWCDFLNLIAILSVNANNYRHYEIMRL
jgi:hypothetical protein